MKVVFPEIHGEHRGDKYFNSATALVLYSWLYKNVLVTKEAKVEIDAMRRSSDNREKMERFRTLLETEGNGVLEATVDHLMKDDYDVAASLKLIDTGESHVISCRTIIDDFQPVLVIIFHQYWKSRTISAIKQSYITKCLCMHYSPWPLTTLYGIAEIKNK